MAESVKDFCSNLLDLSGVSLTELHSSDDPALRSALNRVENQATLAFGTLMGDSQSEEMRFVRGRRPERRRP
ncbi:hypothetical protein [Streptomyces sp. YU58]|uniref:hypothetical protein n=1 Tax=Streptomyces sp. SX92 TaxID=3158972 RepID=UPI0027BA7BCF|nr:hypothetical protein [Streptomyces coralus]WLW53062.1 hypothetical protein QU709_17470 [Streptomyces coralus]